MGRYLVRERRGGGISLPSGAVPPPDPDPDDSVVNVAALPLAANEPPNWTDFPGPSMALGVGFIDTTGVVIRRGTNASTLSANNILCGMEYSPGGPRISLAWGPNKTKYWVTFFVQQYGNGGGPAVFGIYERGVGLDQSSIFEAPINNLGSLGYAFGRMPGEEHIVYMTDRHVTDSRIYRYDVQARQYAPNSVFAGNAAGAYYQTGIGECGYLHFVWDGTRLFYQGNFNAPTKLAELNLVTGVQTIRNYPPGIHTDVKPLKGATRAGVLGYDINSDGTGDWQAWFLASNNLTSMATDRIYGHCDTGETAQYQWDFNDSAFALKVYEIGTDPGEGNAPNGSIATRFAGGGANVMQDGDTHASMAWDQTGAGDQEYYCSDSDATFGPLAEAVIDGFSVFSGEVYRTTLTRVGFGGHARPVTGVIRKVDGNFVSLLAQHGSSSGMPVNSWHWDGTYLYVRMPDDSNPTGNVRAWNRAKLTDTLSMARKDGAEARKVVNTYRHPAADGVVSGLNYSMRCFGNWSPDGKLVVWNSNFGCDPKPSVLTAATNAATVQFTSSAAHGLQTGDEVLFDFMPSGWTSIAYRKYVVTVTGATTFTIAVNSSGFGAFGGSRCMRSKTAAGVPGARVDLLFGELPVVAA